jgi:hypothetical protein
VTIAGNIEEHRVAYGLRLRATGTLLRIEARAESDGDGTDIVHTLTAEPGHPVYDAGSRDRLAAVFANPYPGSAESPLMGRFSPADVEAVVIEEVVRRSVDPAGLAFDVPLAIDTRDVIDVNRKILRNVDGAAEILDAIGDARAAIEGRTMPGTPYAWGTAYLVGIAVPGPVDSLPEGFAGRIIRDRRGNPDRRALAAIPLPSDLLPMLGVGKDAPGGGSLLICLGDARPAPEDLLNALRDLAAPPGPGPR